MHEIAKSADPRLQEGSLSEDRLRSKGKRKKQNRHIGQEEEHEEQAHEARTGTRSKSIKRQKQEASTRTQEARATAEEMPSKNMAVSKWARAQFPDTKVLFHSS